MPAPAPPGATEGLQQPFAATGNTVARSIVPQLLDSLSSNENGVVRLSKSHPIFAGVGLQRLILSFLASGSRPLALVVGPRGSGKSFLVAELERCARRVFRQHLLITSMGSCCADGRSRALALLRDVCNADDSLRQEFALLSNNEALHSGPSLLQAASRRMPGIILLIDDLSDLFGKDLPCWLPSALPAGLHCVATLCSNLQAQLPELPSDDVAVHYLQPLDPAERQVLALRGALEDRGAAMLALEWLESESAFTENSGAVVGLRACCLLAHAVSLQPHAWKEALERGKELVARRRALPTSALDSLGACQTDQDGPEDLDSAVALAVFRICEAQWGALARWAAAFLALTRHGLTVADLASLCERAVAPARAVPGWHCDPQSSHVEPRCPGSTQGTPCMASSEILPILKAYGPLVREVADSTGVQRKCRYALAGRFAVKVCRLFLSEAELAGDTARLLLADHFAAAPVEEGRSGREIEEAAAQLSALGPGRDLASGLLVNFATRPEVLAHFASRGEEVIALWCKASGSCSSIGEQILAEARRAAKIRPWPASRQSAKGLVLAGQLLSTAGEFGFARELLQLACGLLVMHCGDEQLEHAHARALTLLAENEVRYWDSRRDWKSVRALQLLLDSSRSALTILRQWPPDDVIHRRELARALSSRASGCFKAGCVSPAGTSGQSAFFDEADFCTAEAMGLLHGTCTKLAGEAILVGGVTTLCRAQSLMRQGHREEALHAMIKAMAHFYHAEALLRRSVGPVNESSIYTHGNLGELFFHHYFREMPLGLLHMRHSCVVAVQLFHAEHASVKRKLQEFQDIFRQLSWRDFAESVARGRPQDVDPGQLMSRAIQVGLHQGPCSERLAANLAVAAAAPPMAADATPAFWEGLWRDLGARPHPLSRVRGAL